jgi:hypothetical protein
MKLYLSHPCRSAKLEHLLISALLSEDGAGPVEHRGVRSLQVSGSHQRHDSPPFLGQIPLIWKLRGSLTPTMRSGPPVKVSMRGPYPAQSCIPRSSSHSGDPPQSPWSSPESCMVLHTDLQLLSARDWPRTKPAGLRAPIRPCFLRSRLP